jgi:integrase
MNALTMLYHPRPENLIANCIAWIDNPKQGVSEYQKKDVVPAVVSLFNILRRDVKLTENQFVSTLRRNVSAVIKKAPKQMTIWPLAIFIRFVRAGPLPSEMAWYLLMAIAAAILMIYLPCRVIALTRLELDTEERDPDGGWVKVMTQEKTDSGRSRTQLVFRSNKEKRLSPLFYYDTLSDRATGLGVTDAIFCSEAGVAYKRPDVISKGLKDLLERMGIFGYAPYSFRHAMIQALFEAGLDEKQVNAYTGHSNRSHTALDYYYHLDKAWAGVKLSATDRVPITDGALRVILQDGQEDGET